MSSLNSYCLCMNFKPLHSLYVFLRNMNCSMCSCIFIQVYILILCVVDDFSVFKSSVFIESIYSCEKEVYKLICFFSLPISCHYICTIPSTVHTCSNVSGIHFWQICIVARFKWELFIFLMRLKYLNCFCIVAIYMFSTFT